MVALAEAETVSGAVVAQALDAENVTDVNTVEGLKAAFSNGGSYRLTANIDLTELLSVSANKSVGLDLAGHKISASKPVSVSGSLTVSDSSPEGEGTFTTSGNMLFIIRGAVNTSGSLAIKSGVYSAGSSVVSNSGSGVSFTMEGGSLSAPKPVSLAIGNNQTISITGGTITATGAFAVNAAGTGTSVTIGSDNVFDTPVIDGSISLSKLSGENIQFLGGYIKDVSTQLPEGATLNSHFGTDITDVLPMNFASEMKDGAWVVMELTEENAGVKVQSGDQTLYYPSVTAMNGASASIAPGSMITLLKDTSGSLTFSQAGTYVVDLNGHTLTAGSGDANAVRVGASDTDVTIKNGNFVLTPLASGASIVSVVGDESVAALSDVSLVLDGVSLSTTSEYASTGLIVYGLNTKNNITLRNSSISVPSEVMGIYFPPQGDSTLTIDNSTITAGTGIGVKGGTLKVTGNSHITATGENVEPSEPMSSGINETGAAIYLEGNYATSRNVIVDIESGAFESANSEAVQMRFEPTDAPGEGEQSEYRADIEISGGSFSSSPAEFLVTKHVAKVDGGTYEVMPRENLQPGDYVVAEGDGEITSADLQPALRCRTTRRRASMRSCVPILRPW